MNRTRKTVRQCPHPMDWDCIGMRPCPLLAIEGQNKFGNVAFRGLDPCPEKVSRELYRESKGILDRYLSESCSHVAFWSTRAKRPMQESGIKTHGWTGHFQKPAIFHTKRLYFNDQAILKSHAPHPTHSPCGHD